MKTLLVFVLGISVGVGTTGVLWFFNQQSESEVWQTKKELTSSSGVVIPSGTELTLNKYMPEGFVGLELSVSVEGETLNEFKVSQHKEPNLKIPVWVNVSN